MSKNSRLDDLFSSKTDNEALANPRKKNHEIRSLLKQENVIDPTYIQSVKALTPQLNDRLPLLTVALIPFINNQQYTLPSWDLFLLIQRAALDLKISIFNPETQLPLSTYVELGTHNLILDDTSESRSEESYLGNWLVRFGDAVDWFKTNSFPFADQWDASKSVFEVSSFAKTEFEASQPKEDPVGPNDIGAGQVPNTPKTRAPKSNVWDEHALRRLLDESMAAGATQEKLATQYSVSRQFIARKIADAKDKFSKKKARAFDTITGGNRNK